MAANRIKQAEKAKQRAITKAEETSQATYRKSLRQGSTDTRSQGSQAGGTGTFDTALKTLTGT